MRINRFRKQTVCLVFVCLGLAQAGCASQQIVTEGTSLRILLTNDDGSDAPGIAAVRAALVEAGHDVTVVAPSEDQSGSGAQVMSSGTVNIREQSNGVWSVDGSPADAVLVGILHIMQNHPPDLVVSGANFGQNLGYSINSGTVGAATVAMYAGTPAIAVSVGINYSEIDAQPTPFPSTFDAFSGAADFCVRLIDDLWRTRDADGRLLPEHTILNVNYPALGPDDISGVRVLRSARSSGVAFHYEETEIAGQLKVKVRPMGPADTDTDLQAFARGVVTITVFDGDWDAGRTLRRAVEKRLSQSTE
jgi:5'/3'-nucleotidase SurE